MMNRDYAFLALFLVILITSFIFIYLNSVEIREQIVLPLLVIQQYALQQLEKGSPRKAAFEKMVTRSLYGNINASRNSA